MSALWLVVIVVYCVGFLFAVRRIGGQLAWHFVAYDRREYPMTQGHKSLPSGDQWAGALFSAFLLALVWPASLPIAVGIAHGGNPRGMFYMPPAERDRLYRRRIEELERETGVR